MKDFEKLKKKYKVEICKQKAGTKKPRKKQEAGEYGNPTKPSCKVLKTY